MPSDMVGKARARMLSNRTGPYSGNSDQPNKVKCIIILTLLSYLYYSYFAFKCMGTGHLLDRVWSWNALLWLPYLIMKWEVLYTWS